MKKLLLLLLFIPIFYSPGASAIDTLLISDDKKEYIFTDEASHFFMFEDSAGAFTLPALLQSDLFKIPDDKNPRKKANRSYWGVLLVKNISDPEKPFVMEFHDQSIDHLEVYLPQPDGAYKLHLTGDEKPFSFKDVKHKNFVFQLPSLRNQVYTIFIRVKSNHNFAPIIAVKEDLHFAEYAMQEYYYFGILYGLVLAMAFYNLFVFFAMKDRTYLYYVLYVVSFGLYTCASNGTGFQFLWDSFPSFNAIAGSFFRFMFIEFALLYSASFLDIKRSDKIYLITFIALMLLKVVFFSIELFTDDYFDLVDAFLLFVAYAIGFIKLKKGYKPARFFVVGFSILFIGFLLHHFMSVDTTISFFLTILLVYSIQFSAVIEMMFFSLALSDKVRTLSKEKDAMKDRLNRELEEKVKERTRELNTFVYRVSHDLKGPLNSITGLTRLALKDTANVNEYFDHISKTSTRLEGIVADFLNISRTQEGKLSFAKIDFKLLTDTVVNSLKELDHFKTSAIRIYINQEFEFLSDPALLSSVIQNVFENALKYRREENYSHQVKIGIQVNSKEAVLRVQDNGRGIRKEAQQKVFEMFHRESIQPEGTGLGLYIVKATVEKLNGKLKMESEEGKGTTFTIILPNQARETTRINNVFEIEFLEVH